MNREYDYSELIEDYLTGKLPEKQRLELEAQLERNPDLQKDYMLQKDIISSIENTRKAELKTMLNNVTISSGNGFNYFPVQIAGALLVSSMLAVGAYYYLSDDGQNLSENSPIYVEPTPPNDAPAQNIPQVTTDSEGKLIEETATALEEPSEKPSTENNLPVVPEENSGEHSTSNSSPVIIEEKATSGNLESQPGGTELNVETKKDRNHAFHYQYYEDKLFLYGDFKGNGYEIIKLSSPSGLRLYMSYDGQFFKMEKSRKIKSFELVEDPALIEQLQKLKTK
ncbi:MAG: hypothetical protein M3512_01745 [Bacteroidota bacterium]|nr:hypothetical protein [Bacteroidota bacterium]